jgi:hypothetical protein
VSIKEVEKIHINYRGVLEFPGRILLNFLFPVLSLAKSSAEAVSRAEADDVEMSGTETEDWEAH